MWKKILWMGGRGHQLSETQETEIRQVINIAGIIRLLSWIREQWQSYRSPRGCVTHSVRRILGLELDNCEWNWASVTQAFISWFPNSWWPLSEPRGESQATSCNNQTKPDHVTAWRIQKGLSTLPQEPPVPIATNVRGQTGSQDVQEDLGEIDTGGTHRHTGGEREG